jgi:hypothetical protein
MATMETLKMNQVGSSRVDTILKMLLITFISTLAFATGVYFGRETVKSDLELKALENDFPHNTSVAQGEGGAEGDQAISEEEVNALNDKLTSGAKDEAAHGDEGRKVASADGTHETAHGEEADHHDSHADAHAAPAAVAAHGDGHADAHAAPAAPAHGATQGAAPAQAAAHAAPAAHATAPAHAAAPAAAPAHAPQAAHGASAKPDLSLAAQAAHRVANNASPVDPVKAHDNEPRVPTSLPRAVGSAPSVAYTVQIASYPTMEAARDHAEELKKSKSLPAFEAEATVNGKTWYRVSVGAFKTQKDAGMYRAQLMKDMNLPNAIVQKIER